MTGAHPKRRRARRMAHALGTGLTVAAAVLPTGAAAQDSDPFGSILYRSRPEYATPPRTLGSFELTPSVDFATEYIDNVFASDVLDVDDVKVSVTPRLTIRDRRTDRQIGFDMSAGYAAYLDNQIDDRLTLRARGDARMGLGTRTRPFFGFRVQQNDTSSRRFEQFSDTAQPIKLLSYGANAGLEREFGPVTATAEARYDNTDYRGGALVGGTLINEFRDYRIQSGRLRTAYSVNPSQRIYLQGEVTDTEFGEATLVAGWPAGLNADRSSQGYSIRLGFARQLTELLLLDVNVGYLSQEFDDPALSSMSALSFDGNLFYSPSRLTRIQLRASRLIDDTVNPFSNGLLRTEVGAAVEHELRRYLVVFAESFHTDIDADGALGGGNEFRIAGGAHYFLSPQWALRVRGEHLSRNFVFAGNQTRVSASISYNF